MESSNPSPQVSTDIRKLPHGTLCHLQYYYDHPLWLRIIKVYNHTLASSEEDLFVLYTDNFFYPIMPDLSKYERFPAESLVPVKSPPGLF